MTTAYKHNGMVRQGVEVVFADAAGRLSWAMVEHVWPSATVGIPPLLNLSNGTTSVPHYSQVEGASGFYWR